MDWVLEGTMEGPGVVWCGVGLNCEGVCCQIEMGPGKVRSSLGIAETPRRWRDVSRIREEHGVEMVSWDLCVGDTPQGVGAEETAEPRSWPGPPGSRVWEEEGVAGVAGTAGVLGAAWTRDP